MIATALCNAKISSTTRKNRKGALFLVKNILFLAAMCMKVTI